MTPGIELWTKPITAGGDTATVEQQRAAWEQWFGGCHSAAMLDYMLRVSGPDYLSTATCAAAAIKMIRAAEDAGLIELDQTTANEHPIIQRWMPCFDRFWPYEGARKAGVIEYRKGRWHLVEASE